VPTQSNSKRFIFQADAIGVAGQIIHPFIDVVPVQAASALPVDGGFGSARAEGFNHKDILSFDSAYSEVVGTQTDDTSQTVTLSVVEKFNLLDVVTCDRIVVRLTAKYPGEYQDGSECSIVPTGSRFEGLRVGDKFFDILEVAPDYFCRPDIACWAGLQKALGDEKDRRILAPLSLPGPDGNPVPLPDPGQRQDVLGFCIALDKPKPDDVLGAPLRIIVPDFGTVHLGEFFCYPASRVLIMLRVEFDCSHSGRAVGAHCMIRVQPYPP